MTKREPEQTQPQPATTCPNCGYCPTCGRPKTVPIRPPWYPTYTWTYPFYTSTSTRFDTISGRYTY